MFFIGRAALFVACLILAGFSVGSASAATQMGPKTNYSAAEVAAAIRNSGLNSNLMQYANDIGSLSQFESSGNTGIYNGTCCTGILQMNRSNLAAQGLTPQQYANMSLQDQVNAWAKLTNSAANAGSVKQLMAMESFDGQKVDGALVLACIQLGTGNCQKMIRSGSCSGFADSNGTTICKMADKIRGGKAEGSNSDNTTKPDETKGDESGASDLAQAILKNAGKCWACTIIVKAGEVTVQVVPKALDSLTQPIMPLMGVLFAIVTMFMVGRGFIWPGAMRWTEIFWNFMRFTAVWALLSTANYASEYVLGYAFYPALQMGSAIGEIGGQQFGAAFQNGGAGGTCEFAPVDTSLPFEGRSTVEHMATLACNVHTAAYAPVVAGAAMISYQGPMSTPSEIATAALMSVLAAIMIFASLFALAAFAMSVVEALLKLCIVLSLAPIILFFWIFRKTRYLALNAFNAIMYGFFLLAFAGLLASISSFVLSRLIGFGMGAGGSTPSAQAVFQWINTNMASMNVSQLVLFGCFSIAGSMMASHLIRAGSDMASSLTGVRMGQITGNVMAGLNSIGQKAFILPAAGAGMLTTYAGAKAGAGALGLGAAGLGQLAKGLASGPLGKMTGASVK